MRVPNSWPCGACLGGLERKLGPRDRLGRPYLSITPASIIGHTPVYSPQVPAIDAIRTIQRLIPKLCCPSIATPFRVVSFGSQLLYSSRMVLSPRSRSVNI
eukprot:Rmarinus@m.19332